MFGLEKFKNILGEPGKGIHFHILGIAWVDVIGTIIVGWLIAWLTGIHSLIGILSLFAFGEFLHLLFGVETTIVKTLTSVDNER